MHVNTVINMHRVRGHISAARCACDLRNPRGRCCLGELTETVARLSYPKA